MLEGREYRGGARYFVVATTHIAAVGEGARAGAGGAGGGTGGGGGGFGTATEPTHDYFQRLNGK